MASFQKSSKTPSLQTQKEPKLPTGIFICHDQADSKTVKRISSSAVKDHIPVPASKLGATAPAFKPTKADKHMFNHTENGNMEVNVEDVADVSKDQKRRSPRNFKTNAMLSSPVKNSKTKVKTGAQTTSKGKSKLSKSKSKITKTPRAENCTLNFTPNKCEICSKEFKNSQNLREHIVFHHTEDGKLLYKKKMEKKKACYSQNRKRPYLRKQVLENRRRRESLGLPFRKSKYLDMDINVANESPVPEDRRVIKIENEAWN